MTKDFDIVDMGDKKAEKFAEAVKNPTSKKIWQFLKKRSASQKEISERLGIPMPTVHYSLGRLISAGFVEKEDYYWSPKGNKVHTYRASKKIMVFAPNKTPFLEQHLRSVLSIAVVFVAIIALVAFQGAPDSSTTPSIELKRFASDAELLEAVKGLEGSSLGGRERVFAAESLSATAAQTSDAAAGAGGSNADFSTTNVQVKGVDEADIIKTDGEYIYFVSRGTFIIAQALPAKDAQVLSQMEIGSFYPTELFIAEDRVLLFGSRHYYDEADEVGSEIRESSFPYHSDFTEVKLLDVSDKEKPKQLRTLSFQGSYLTSRKVGDWAYFVVNSYPTFHTLETCADGVPRFADVTDGEPKIADQKPIAPCTEIGYIDSVKAQSFITVAAISMEDENSPVSKETILGSADAVYASKDNIYIAQSVYPDGRGFGPILFETGADEGTVAVEESEDSPKLGEPVEPEELKKEERTLPSTVVTKFEIQDGTISFEGTGEVAGHILNQFSMDEHEGNFRIATTTREWTRAGDNSRNSLYVLDKDLEQIGAIEDIAPGESIYAARFMAEKAYLVTFKQIDPLFVIDLEDPTNPTVLGKLKIPGFSNYLHPIGDGYLLGIGQEVEEISKGRFATTGVKIAIFDVSDVTKPREIHKEVLGGRYSTTIAQYDHRAVLFDEARELFVLPVTLVEDIRVREEESEIADVYYPGTSFQGAYVYDVSVADGFDLRGEIAHYTAEEARKFGDYYYGYEVMRSLYIGDVLYTLSDAHLQATDLNTLEKITRLDFEGDL